MTKKQQARRRLIIAELARMSHNSWHDARPCDYRPLEAELGVIEAMNAYKNAVSAMKNRR